MTSPVASVPRIESLHVKGYRALKDLKLKNISPLTVLIGPNGSGKSTILDVFAFLSECFTSGIIDAWEKRGGLRSLLTLGANPPMVIELKCRETAEQPLITYHLAINELQGEPYIAEEWVQCRNNKTGKLIKLLDFKGGAGYVIANEDLDQPHLKIIEKLGNNYTLAVGAFGQFGRYPRLGFLHRMIKSWNVYDLNRDIFSLRKSLVTKVGISERLATEGENLANVIQYLQTYYPTKWRQIEARLAQLIPNFERLQPLELATGQLGFEIKERCFNQTSASRYVASGLLKMLAYLVVLQTPKLPALLALEEPENDLHPRLLAHLATDCHLASQHTQLIITTHSPLLLNNFYLDEVYVIYRDKDGYTQARRPADMPGVPELIAAGTPLGYLWMQGDFDAGDPLINSGQLQPDLPAKVAN